MLRPKYERHRRGWSQRTLAIAAGISQPFIGPIENGRLTPTPAQLKRLASVFGVWPPEALLKEVTILEEASLTAVTEEPAQALLSGNCLTVDVTPKESTPNE